MELRLKAKKWGSSMGVIIPKRIIESNRIKENDEIVIEIKREPLLARDIFGMLRGKMRKSTQEIKDEMRRGWESKTDRTRRK